MHKINFSPLSGFFLALSLLAGCTPLSLQTSAATVAPTATAPTTQANVTAVYPGRDWETIAPDTLSAACMRDLDDARNYLQTLPTTALLAVQDGRVLFRYGPVDRVSVIFSARKSILAMMYGKYVADGRIDLEKTMADLHIDDIGGLLPVEQQATVRDLLTARSGVYHIAANGGDDQAYAPPRGSQTPGSYFLYNNWDFNAAGTVFEHLTGRSLYQTFADDLATPLQLQDFDLARHQRKGGADRSMHAPYHFFLSTRDMARLGYLMLRQGNWQGRQLVAADWVTRITSPVTMSTDMHPARRTHMHIGYGYLWWLPEEPADSPLNGAYMAWGIYGQHILVIPRRGMVIADKRQVPDGDNADPTKVRIDDFLKAARMLAGAPCH